MTAPVYLAGVIDKPQTRVWYKKMSMSKSTINDIMKTMKENSPLKDVCPDKKLTNNSARKMVLKKLKSSRIPKCEIKNIVGHSSEQGFRRLWLRWKRAKNYVQHHRQCLKCKTSTPTYPLSANCTQSSVLFQLLQCNAQHRWKPLFTIKSKAEQVRWQENLYARFWLWLAEFCSGLDPYICWKQVFPNWTF